MLVERIINKIIKEKVDIDRILIVTFTNAAAAEIRERILEAIYKKIEEEPANIDLQKQITLLNKASICTIDAFCLDIIKNNFFEIGISPNFRIGEQAEIEILKLEAIENLFERKYEENDSEFIKLIETYTNYKKDDDLKELILKIYSFIQSTPFPKTWLNEKIEMLNIKEDVDFSETVWGKLLLKDIENEIIDGISTLNRLERKLEVEPELKKYHNTIVNDITGLNVLKNSLKLWDLAYEESLSFKFETWPRDTKIESFKKDEAKLIRDGVKKKVSDKLGKILKYTSSEAKQDINDMYDVLIKLKNLILEFDTEFKKQKNDRNILDFNDIEHYALEILLKEDENGNLIQTPVAQKYIEKFNEIDIDEYQDSNLIQEFILTSISNGKNLFMVGDVKQSIYKFRQARPELFISKYETYKLESELQQDDDLKIQLFKNFRSKETILDFTNIIFDKIMAKELGDIDYNEQEYLNLGASYPEIEKDKQVNQGKIEIDLINLNTEKNDFSEKEEEFSTENEQDVENNAENERIEDIEVEARFVANRIKDIIDGKYQVFDKKTKQYRDVTFKDIVILLRVTSNIANIYEKEIEKLSYPVFSDSNQEYLNSIEIQTIMSLLKIIDNPMQDIPLVTVLRSPIGNFTDNDLVEVRLYEKYENFYRALQKSMMNVSEELSEKIKKFLHNLDDWREKQEYLALDELIWQIYTDTGYYNYVGLMPNGNIRQANLKMLFERAKQYESGSFKGLYNFIKFIEKLRLGNGDLSSAKLIGENEDVIRIMSMHKSKGLEFPIVFLAGTGKSFNFMDLNSDILLHQDLGIGVKYIDYERKIEYNTLTKEAMRLKMKNEILSEEMRMLYVGLTRAKEILIVTGLTKDYDKNMNEKLDITEKYIKEQYEKISPIVIGKYKTYMDWLILVYLYHKEQMKDFVDFNVINKDDVIKNMKNAEVVASNNIIDILNSKSLEENTKQDINKILNWTYGFKSQINLPTKSSVTKLKQMENEGIISLEEIGNKNIDLTAPNFLNKDRKITGAEKGTLLHLCMQKLEPNTEYTLESIKNLIYNLVQLHIITAEEAEVINPYKILNFTKSEIWSEIKKSNFVYKERPFYMNVKASDVLEIPTDESILVQGIVDLYYINENGNIVIVDYKTDFVETGKEQELINRYTRQLELYKNALENATGKVVEKMYIYSTFLDKQLQL